MEHLGNNIIRAYGITCHVLFNYTTLKYDSTLLGGEFGNCHGVGSTLEFAMLSCKIRVNQLRRQFPGIFVLYNPASFSNIKGKVIEVKPINDHEYMIISPIPKFDGATIKQSDCERIYTQTEVNQKINEEKICNCQK